jgi:polysaccharide export outer membrane protein
MFLQGTVSDDMPLVGGDTVFVKRAPTFYIYGEVQKPGVFRLERNMTLMQAVATGGGITAKGTTRGIVVNRRSPAGDMKEANLSLSDRLMDDDVVYVKQSLF